MTVAPLRPPVGTETEGVTQGHSYPSQPNHTGPLSLGALLMPGQAFSQHWPRYGLGNLQCRQPSKWRLGPSVPPSTVPPQE